MFDFRAQFETGEITNFDESDDTFIYYGRSQRDFVFDICYIAWKYRYFM